MKDVFIDISKGEIIVNRIVCVFVFFICLISLFSCSNLGLAQRESGLSFEKNGEPGCKDTILEKSRYYTIYELDNLYYYCIYGINGDVIGKSEYSPIIPKITNVYDNVLRVTMQAGTGLGTQYGYYCNVSTGEISEVFYSIHDQYYGMVAYGCVDTVVIQNIFEKNAETIEITSFSKPFADSVTPIVKARFVENGQKVEITYLHGEDFEEVVECFFLDTRNLRTRE